MKFSKSSEAKKSSLVKIIVIALLTFIGVLTETSMNVTFPTLMRQFEVSLSTIQCLTTGYLLVVALLMMTSAYLNHSFGQKKLFITACILFIVGDLICANSNNYTLLLTGRLIQSGCVGISGPLLTNVILDSVSKQKLGTYLGLGNLIILVGPALGPSFGGAMVSCSSWRSIFWVSLPIVLLLLVIGTFNIENKVVEGSERYNFDWMSFILFSLFISFMMLGINGLGNIFKTVDWLGWFLLSLMFFVIFFIRSRKKFSSHFINFDVLKSPIFLLSFIPYTLLQFSNLSINFLLPNFVQLVNNAIPLIGGLILLPGSIFNGFGQPIYGWLLDKFGGKLPLYIGNLIFFVTAFCLSIFIFKVNFVGLTFLYAIFALGRSMAFGNTMAFGLKKMKPLMAPDANALYSTGQQIAGSLGTNITAIIVSNIHVKSLSLAENTAIGSQLVCGLIAIIGIINFICFFKLFKESSNF